MWQGPYPAFRPPAGFWATKQFWAPEVHRWQDRYVMLASFKRDGVLPRHADPRRRNAARVPFLPHSDGPVTPRTWECLDGTLYVDEHGDPWIVFCHEWVQVGDGEICAQRLTHDLRAVCGEPVLLFRASDAPWCEPTCLPSGNEGYVTNGPFLYRAGDGALFMLWSSFTGAFVQGSGALSHPARSSAPGTHQRAPLFRDDGGHGMLFTAFDGQLMLVLHTPNRSLPMNVPACCPSPWRTVTSAAPADPNRLFAQANHFSPAARWSIMPASR